MDSFRHDLKTDSVYGHQDMDYGLTLWCALGLFVGGGDAVQVSQLQLQ